MATKDAQWTRNYPKLSYEGLCDNKAAISIAKNPVHHDWTKHVEIDRHFIKEKLDNEATTLEYFPSSMQIADILTKRVSKPTYEILRSNLGMVDIYHPAWGGVLEDFSLYVRRISNLLTKFVID